MRDQEIPTSFVQITGRPEHIADLLDHEIMDGARRCDLHGHAWIEMGLISDEQMALAVSNGCRVHFIQTSPYSQGEWHQSPPS